MWPKNTLLDGTSSCKCSCFRKQQITGTFVKNISFLNIEKFSDKSCNFMYRGFIGKTML